MKLKKSDFYIICNDNDGEDKLIDLLQDSAYELFR